MKLLDSFSRSNRQLEQIKALGNVFRFSRSEDIAKVFELGRIEALSVLKKDVWYTLGIIGSIVTIGGFFLGWLLVPKYIDSIVDSRVEREIDKRIDKFSKFYNYSQEVLSILEYDFYKIKSLGTDLKIKTNTNIEKLVKDEKVFGIMSRLLIPKFKLSVVMISDTNSYEFLSFFISEKESDYSFHTDQDYRFPVFKYLLNNQIDLLQSFKQLEIKISHSVDTKSRYFNESVLHKSSSELETYINSLDEITFEAYVNKISFYKKIFRKDDFKKSGELEYSYKLNPRDVFNMDGSANTFAKMHELERASVVALC